MRSRIWWVSSVLVALAAAEQWQTPLPLQEQLAALQEQLEKEANDDKGAYEELDCWCKMYLPQKERVVDDMHQQLHILTHDIEAQTAVIQRLQYELDDHEHELGDSQRDLDTAKALRDNGAKRFNEEEQLHVQGVNQLDAALQALGGNHPQALTLSQMRSNTNKANALGRALRGPAPDNPGIVHGVLKEMRSVFQTNLKELRDQESSAATRHQDLVEAKAHEINALKKRVLQKTELEAEDHVEVTRKQEQKDKATRLLDANVQLVASMRGLCKGADDSFHVRWGLRQKELVDIAAAQAALHGTQLLATANADGGPAAEPLCRISYDLLDREWRRTARQACNKARAGHLQDAAESAQDLADDMIAEQANLTTRAEDCKSIVQELSGEVQEAAHANSVQESAVRSKKQEVEEDIESINQQALNCGKAKAALVEAQRSQAHAAQGTVTVANSVQVSIMRVQRMAPAGVALKLERVLASSKELLSAAAAFEATNAKQAEDVIGFLDGAVLAASKALIPLHLIRADTEEAAVEVHMKQQRPRVLPEAGCDADALSARAGKLRNDARRLGEIAAKLSYAALR